MVRHPETTRFEKVATLMSIAANVTVVAGIIFAGFQFSHTKHSEKLQTAINAVNQTRSSDFLKAYTRLKTASLEGIQPPYPIPLIDDLNYVMNTYDNISLLYLSDLADRCVVRDGTHAATKEMSSIADSLSYPKEYRKNFDRFVALMEAKACE